LFLDANIIIYSVEGNPQLRSRISTQLAALHAGPTVLSTSILSRLECRVKPLRTKNQKLLDEYERIFSTYYLIPIALPTIERATDLRAQHNFKAFDAIQVASALEAQCDTFITADMQLARTRGISVVLINP
jgi:predicted nucleic acid-binding protein